MAETENDLGGVGDLTGGDAGGEGTPAPAPAPADGDAGGGDDAAQAAALDEWLGKFSADASDGHSASDRDWVKAKGYKDLGALVKSARSGDAKVDGMIKLAGEGANDDEVKAFRAAIGVPEDVKCYEIKPPEGVKL